MNDAKTLAIQLRGLVSADEFLAPAVIRPNDQNPYLVYLGSLRRMSLPAMNLAVRVLTAMLVPGAHPGEVPWERLRYQHVQKVRSLLADSGYSPAMGNKVLVAARRIAEEAWKLGLMTQEEYAKIRSVKKVVGSRLLAGREVARAEAEKLLGDMQGDGSFDVRDSAVVALLWATGVRRTELAMLLVEKYDRVQQTIVVIGKRNKERRIEISQEVVDRVERWLDLRGREDGRMFCHILRTGVLRQHESLTSGAVYAILKRRQEAVGAEKLFSPHDLRRTFASDQLDQGTDIKTVADLMGHDNVNTTASYDRRGDAARRKAVDGRALPIRPKVHIDPSADSGPAGPKS